MKVADNRWYRVNKHPIGCTTGWVFVYTMQPVVQPVVQPAVHRQPVVSCKRGTTE